jgi:hypothetical protein
MPASSNSARISAGDGLRAGLSRLAGRPLAPQHLRREHPGLGEHAVGHRDTVNLVGVQLADDPRNENPCATSDVGSLRAPRSFSAAITSSCAGRYT